MKPSEKERAAALEGLRRVRRTASAAAAGKKIAGNNHPGDWLLRIGVERDEPDDDEERDDS